MTAASSSPACSIWNSAREVPGTMTGRHCGAACVSLRSAAGSMPVSAVEMAPMRSVPARPSALASLPSSAASRTRRRARGSRATQAWVGRAAWPLRESRAKPSSRSSACTRWPTAAAVRCSARAASAMEPLSTTAIRLLR